MWGNRAAGGWGRSVGGYRSGLSLRGLLKVMGAVVGVTVVATAVVPGLGVLIAVAFWLVAAAAVGAVAMPAVRWGAPHVRTAGARLAAALIPAAGPRWRRWVAWCDVAWAQAQMWTGRTRHAWRRSSPAALERGPRALPTGTTAPRAESRSQSPR